VTEEYAALPADNAYRGVLKQIRIDLAERTDGPSVEEQRRVVMGTH
jgi:arylsulfatase